MKTALVALSTALAVAAPAHAEDTTPSDIVVTAARGTALKDMDVSTTVLDADQVAAMPTTATDQVINHIPGLFTLNEPAAQLHPTGDTFNIRGFGTTTNINTLVMLDGIPLNDPYFRTIDWNTIPKGQIAGIEVIRGGGATSLWGNMAMGGIVNIRSRDPDAGHMDADFNLGSYHTLSGAASAGFALSPMVTAGLSVSDAASDGYNQTPAQYRNALMSATASANTNVQGEIRAHPSPDTNLFVTVLWHRLQEHGLIWAPTQNRWESWRLAFGGDTALAGGRLALAGWYGSGLMNTTNVNQSPSYSIFTPTTAVPYVVQQEDATYHNLGGSLTFTADHGALHDIKLGVDGRTIEANDPLNLYGIASQSGSTITTTQTGTIVAHAQHHFEGVFAQATLTPPGLPLDVTLGLRGDFWQADNGSINGYYKTGTLADPLAGQSYARFDPRLGAKLRLAPELTLRGAVYSNFAAPGMNQMYRAFVSGTGFSNANPDLKPQTNVGEEAGVDLTGPGALSGLTLSVTAYANALKNFIDYATVNTACSAANTYCGTGIPISTLRQYINAGNAEFRGIEVLGGWTIGRFALSGGYTYTDAHITASGAAADPSGFQVGEVPTWVATGTLTWRATSRLRLTAGIKSFPSYRNNTAHTQRNDGATTVDLGASWVAAKGIEIYTSLQNVGNVHYLDQGLTYTTSNGSIVSSSSAPTLAMPFWATFGIRVHI